MDYWTERIPELFVHNTGMKLKVLNRVVYLRFNIFFLQWLMDCSKNGRKMTTSWVTVSPISIIKAWGNLHGIPIANAHWAPSRSLLHCARSVILCLNARYVDSELSAILTH